MEIQRELLNSNGYCGFTGLGGCLGTISGVSMMDFDGVWWLVMAYLADQKKDFLT